jgi:hypothetical protein
MDVHKMADQMKRMIEAYQENTKLVGALQTQVQAQETQLKQLRAEVEHLHKELEKSRYHMPFLLFYVSPSLFSSTFLPLTRSFLRLIYRTTFEFT